MFKGKAKLIIIAIMMICILNLSFFIVLAQEDEGSVEKTGFKLNNYFDDYILVGLAELYLGSNNLSGNLEAVETADDFQEVVDKGRLSFYLKGKIKGKYLLTAWLDTGEEDFSQIFSNLTERRVSTPFEKIDPDQYYPVYGDNSKISSEANTASKLYLCLEAEEFKALWGNYKINYNSNNLINYNRSMYGFNFEYDSFKHERNYRSDSNSSDKGHAIYTNLFWNQPFSLNAVDELQVTGGMLYYLSRDDLLVGSESLTLELRDTDTDRVKDRVILTEGIDYDINYLQGRVILKKSVTSLLGEADQLIEDESSPERCYLVADYSYDYDYQDSSRSGYGLEAAYSPLDNLKLTGNYIKKQADNGQAYQVSGLNIDYSPAAETTVKLNWARSENILSGRYISDDGGLTYSQVPLTDSNGASAWTADFKKKGLEVYYGRKEEGFSSGSQLTAEDQINYGLKMSGATSDLEAGVKYDGRVTESEKADINSIYFKKEYNEKLDIEGEIENERIADNDIAGSKETRLAAVLGFDYKIDESKKIYGSQQLTLAKSTDAEANNLTKLGGELKQGKWRFNAEGMTGSSDSLSFGAGYQINEKSEIYSKISRRYTDGSVGSTETTVGTKSSLNEDVEVYGEHRTEESEEEREESNVIGVDYAPLDNWQLSLDFSKSDEVKEDAGKINRKIIGLGSRYNDQKASFDSRMEYRKDNGSEELEQFIMSGNLSWNYNEELKVLSELEYSKDFSAYTQTEDKHIKGTVGLAYRPVELDRLNLIGKYNYLEDKQGLAADDDVDDRTEDISNYPAERSQVFAVDAVYDINTKWQLAEKIAYKNGKVKLNSLDDDWTSSQTYLWTNRLNYQWREDIEFFGEYRVLDNSLAQDRKSGFLLGGYKEFDNNLKLGVGYNFTDFNDDLTDLSYKAHGFFVNLIKVW